MELPRILRFAALGFFVLGLITVAVPTTIIGAGALVWLFSGLTAWALALVV